MNLESRTKWHYLLNNGFVPILEVPDLNPYFGQQRAVITESRIIMDYLNSQLKLGLYSQNDEADQVNLMRELDAFPPLFVSIALSKGKDTKTVQNL